jgi:hypothetical protein
LDEDEDEDVDEDVDEVVEVVEVVKAETERGWEKLVHTPLAS